VYHVDARHHLEQLSIDVLRASNTARRHVDLTGVGFDVGNELGDRLSRKRRVHLQDAYPAIYAGHRSNVAHEIEIQLVV
jgi:hypothetical protein